LVPAGWQLVSSTVEPALETQATVRPWLPPPQATEQGPQGPVDQEKVTLEQDAVLQACDVAGLELAQLESATTVPWLSWQVTERVWTPPPQATEQVPQAPVAQLYEEPLLMHCILIS